MTRMLILLLFVGAGLHWDPLAAAGAPLQAPLSAGLAVLLVLACVGLVLGPARGARAVLSGLVVVVEHDTGTIALQHADGTRTHLVADPWLLRGVRFGDPVQAVVEGNVVRALGPPGTARRRGRRTALGRTRIAGASGSAAGCSP